MATNKRIDEIIDVIDENLRADRFEGVDNTLRSLDVRILDTDELIAYLSSTLPAKSKLPYRPEFYSSAEIEIRNRGEYEKGLLDGLN